MLVYLVVPRLELGTWIANQCISFGHTVRAYASGELAIDACAQESCDVLVVDRALPGRDGLVTVETIRGLPGGPSIRVGLVLESEAHETAAMLASRIDAASVLVGSGDEESVARFVERILRLEGSRTGKNTAKMMSLSNPFTGEVALPEGRPTFVDARQVDRDTLRGQSLSGDANGADVLLLSTEGEAVVDEASFEEATWVERAIRNAEKKADRIEGTFQARPFAEVLAQMADERRDGGLVCSSTALGRRTVDGHTPTKVICFRAGVPIDVRSNLVDESLLALLFRQRRIDGARYEAACRMEREYKMSSEDVILQQRLLDPVELADVLAEQLRFKIIDIFSWRTGNYFLANNVEPPARAVGLPYSFAELLYDGVRTAMPMSWLMEYVAALESAQLALVTSALTRVARLTLPAPVSDALRAISGTTTVRDFVALASVQGQARAAMEALYTLVCMGVLRVRDDEPLDGFAPEHLVRTVEAPADVPTHVIAPNAASRDDGPTRVVDIASLEGRSLRPQPSQSVPAPSEDESAEDKNRLREDAARETVRGTPKVASSQDLVVAGVSLLRAEQWRDAHAAFGAALVMDSTRQDAGAYQALAAIGIARITGAGTRTAHVNQLLDLLARTVESHPRSASLRYALARAFELLGELDSARDAVRQAVAIDPSHEDAVQLLRRTTGA